MCSDNIQLLQNLIESVVYLQRGDFIFSYHSLPPMALLLQCVTYHCYTSTCILMDFDSSLALQRAVLDF